MGMDGEPAFQAAVLVPSKQELQLQTVPLAVAAFPSKAGNQLIKALGSAAPLSDLRHLKRVRKAPDDGALLEAILCALPAPAAGSDAERNAAGLPTVSDQADSAGVGVSAIESVELPLGELPDALRGLYTQHGGARLRLMHGAAVPPQTRQQWEVWTKLWPITWRIPDHGTPVTEETPVDAQTQHYFEHHMRHALRLAATAGVDNAAVIANPPSLTPVAEAADGSAAHPLQHAVMAAIQAASERDLVLWPPAASGEPDGQPAGRSGDGMSVDTAAAGESGMDGHLRCDAAASCPTTVEAPQDALSALGCEEAKGWRPSAAQGEATGSIGGASADGTAAAAADAGEELATKRPRLGAGPEQESQACAASTRPYMCTGYDCFLVMEPCIMCAMALVHSRVQRVIFCRPDPVHGALGGERRLHACRSLNHNYEVFRMELKK